MCPHGGFTPAPLTTDEVHVWYVFSGEVRDPRLLDRYAGLLTAEERARHDRFSLARIRHQFLITRGVLRDLVAQYLNVEPTDCVFQADPRGRPSLRAPAGRPLEFSLSHTNGLVAVAIAKVPEIGVDVEDVERPGATLTLARRFFSPYEADSLEALPASAQVSRFFDYWTLKEAYIKARGIGLSLPLAEFSMHLDAAGPPRISFSGSIDVDPESWQFAQFSPGPRHRLAVAVRGGRRDLSIRIRELVPSAT